MSSELAFLRYKRPVWKQAMSSEIAVLRQKTADLRASYELWTPSFTSNTTDTKWRDELRTRTLAFKMAGLHLSPEHRNLVICSFVPNMADLNLSPELWKNGDEMRWTILKPALWHLRVKLRTCFLGGRVVSCRSVGGSLFRTHSEQRARASRGQKSNPGAL